MADFTDKLSFKSMHDFTGKLYFKSPDSYGLIMQTNFRLNHSGLHGKLSKGPRNPTFPHELFSIFGKGARYYMTQGANLTLQSPDLAWESAL